MFYINNRLFIRSDSIIIPLNDLATSRPIWLMEPGYRAMYYTFDEWVKPNNQSTIYAQI